MEKKLIGTSFLLVLVLISSVFLYEYLVVKQQCRSVPDQTKPQTNFFGEKLSINYYQFNILDYHRLLMQKKPFLLFFYDPTDTHSQDQQQVIIKTQTQISKFEHPILRIDDWQNNTSGPTTGFKDLYKVNQPNTLVVIDKDSNPVSREIGQKTPAQIINLFSKI